MHAFVCAHVCVRERDTGREKQRQRETQRESQTDKQGERERGRRTEEERGNESASVHVYSCVHMEVRAQLSGAASSLPTGDSGIDVIRCVHKVLLPDETCRQPLSTDGF